MSEDKITLTANEFGTPILDLTKAGLSLNDCDTLHRWQMGLQGRAESRERERIIKLLEESDSVCNEWAIALIKGEN
jgi:hypothetical protein